MCWSWRCVEVEDVLKLKMCWAWLLWSFWYVLLDVPIGFLLSLDLMSGEALQPSPWDSVPSPSGQKYFENWDYISPYTYKLELGLEESVLERAENVRDSCRVLDSTKPTVPAWERWCALGVIQQFVFQNSYVMALPHVVSLCREVESWTVHQIIYLRLLIYALLYLGKGSFLLIHVFELRDMHCGPTGDTSVNVVIMTSNGHNKQ